MPELIKIILRNAAIGFAIAALFVALLISLDVGGLGSLIANSDVGIGAALLLFFLLGLTFGSAQIGFAIMLEGSGGNGRPGGSKYYARRKLMFQPVRITVKE